MSVPTGLFRFLRFSGLLAYAREQGRCHITSVNITENYLSGVIYGALLFVSEFDTHISLYVSADYNGLVMERGRVKRNYG